MEGDTVYLWPIHVDVWQKPLQYCNYPPIKKKKGKKNRISEPHTQEISSLLDLELDLGITCFFSS